MQNRWEGRAKVEESQDGARNAWMSCQEPGGQFEQDNMVANFSFGNKTLLEPASTGAYGTNEGPIGTGSNRFILAILQT